MDCLLGCLIWPDFVLKTNPGQYPVLINGKVENVVFVPSKKGKGVHVTFWDLIVNEPWILSRQEEAEFIGQVYGKEAALNYLKNTPGI